MIFEIENGNLRIVLVLDYIVQSLRGDSEKTYSVDKL